MASPLTGGGLIQFTRSKEGSMKRILCSLIVATLPFGASFAQTAPQPIVAPLMQQDLADMPGREMLMLSVEYPPGTVEHIHRHDAYAFVYVLEGTIVEGVKGGKEVTLTPGQTFYEGPNDVHTIGRNASTTRPAKFVVVLVKKKGVDAVLPVE
jgi:quercetin dioxygenase-like cupin family protein